MNKTGLKKLIRMLNSKPVDEIPKGWMCRSDIEKEYGMAHSTASRYIKYILDNHPNKITVKKFTVKTGTGGTLKKPYYLITL